MELQRWKARVKPSFWRQNIFMSYQPILLINHAQLQDHREYIQKMGQHIGKHTLKSDGYAILGMALDLKPMVFQIDYKELHLILVTLEFSKHNAEVRKLLTAMQIEYKEWN